MANIYSNIYILQYMSRVLHENDAVRLNGVPPQFEAVRQVMCSGVAGSHR